MFGDVSNKFMFASPHNHTHAHRHAHHVTALPYCVDDEPGHVTLGGKVCSTIQGQAAFLCNGLLAMQQASCEELASEWFMRSMVEKVGLVPDGRGAAIYGNYSKAMVQVHTKAARGKVGLWQSPAQLAAALIYVGSRVEVKRYIEVGVYTAWTCCFVSAYLRRVGRLGTFKGYAVDLVSTNIAHGTRDLLPKLNVTFTFRKSVVLNKTLPYDFCFIDGDHAYLGVRRDYASFAPSCNYMMFHDIQVTVITPLTACCVLPSLPPHALCRTRPRRIYPTSRAASPCFGRISQAIRESIGSPSSRTSRRRTRSCRALASASSGPTTGARVSPTSPSTSGRRAGALATA